MALVVVRISCWWCKWCEIYHLPSRSFTFSVNTQIHPSGSGPRRRESLSSSISSNSYLLLFPGHTKLPTNTNTTITRRVAVWGWGTDPTDRRNKFFPTASICFSAGIWYSKKSQSTRMTVIFFDEDSLMMMMTMMGMICDDSYAERWNQGSVRRSWRVQVTFCAPVHHRQFDRFGRFVASVVECQKSHPVIMRHYWIGRVLLFGMSIRGNWKRSVSIFCTKCGFNMCNLMLAADVM